MDVHAKDARRSRALRASQSRVQVADRGGARASRVPVGETNRSLSSDREVVGRTIHAGDVCSVLPVSKRDGVLPSS